MELIVNLVIGGILLKYVLIILGLLLCWILSFRNKKKKLVIEKIQISQDKHAVKRSNLLICSKKKMQVLNFIDGVRKYELSFVSRIPSHFVRKEIYKRIFSMKIAENVVIYKGLVVRKPQNISIGKGSVIGDDNMLDGREGIFIGENVNLSSQVRIWTGQHSVQGKKFEYEGSAVTIGNRAWISGNVTILPGVSIAEGAVVASGAVVTKNIEPYTIYAGVPAKKIGERNRQIDYDFVGSHEWFY